MDILEEHSTDRLWSEDEEIRIMREPYSKQFYEEWRKGFADYLGGNWVNALENLTRANSLSPGGSDGPS